MNHDAPIDSMTYSGAAMTQSLQRSALILLATTAFSSAVLIAGPTMFRKRLHVASDDFRAEDSTDLSGSHESRVAHVVAR